MILNETAFNAARDIYAQEMGFVRADGSIKPISKIAQEALEVAIITYIIKDSRLGLIQ